MFIKITFDSSEGDEPEVFEQMMECKKYRLKKREDGLYLSLDDNESIHEISNCFVWVMNNEGRTIDRIR